MEKTRRLCIFFRHACPHAHMQCTHTDFVCKKHRQTCITDMHAHTHTCMHIYLHNQHTTTYACPQAHRLMQRLAAYVIFQNDTKHKFNLQLQSSICTTRDTFINALPSPEANSMVSVSIGQLNWISSINQITCHSNNCAVYVYTVSALVISRTRSTLVLPFS